jgi:flagellar L-ring protein precursor FlgH
MSVLRPVKAAAVAIVLATASAAIATSSVGADLYKGGVWPSLASDRRAERVGDSLTVLIYQAAQATDSTQHGASRKGSINGQLSAGSYNKSAQAALGGTYDGQASTGRSGQVVAQLGVVVDAVLPNGDLHVAGEQSININGDRTKIRFRGRVRHEDISNNNTVLSSQLADVTIDYGSAGFVARSDKPSPVNRIFDWLGLP